MRTRPLGHRRLLSSLLRHRHRHPPLPQAIGVI
ncbi:hypothetical protein ERO13_A02G099901v2 [Gossypium hirsutum]|nr:hypothetical protein ERO13_A02G099901v2 [Gossypium hirsutum]